MCGLSAIFSLTSSPVIDGEIESMHYPIASRGPDGEGFYRDSTIALAHRRLAIIDTSSSANQPFHLNDRYVLVFNGEIYNYREIRSQLIQLGFAFLQVLILKFCLLHIPTGEIIVSISLTVCGPLLFGINTSNVCFVVEIVRCETALLVCSRRFSLSCFRA